MEKRERAYSDIYDRRIFFRTVATTIAAIIAEKLEIEINPKLEKTTKSQEYLAINGWVLTRQDVSLLKLPSNVVRL